MVHCLVNDRLAGCSQLNLRAGPCGRAQHGCSHRTPNGKQHSQQHQEPDTPGFHERKSSRGGVPPNKSVGGQFGQCRPYPRGRVKHPSGRRLAKSFSLSVTCRTAPAAVHPFPRCGPEQGPDLAAWALEALPEPEKLSKLLTEKTKVTGVVHETQRLDICLAVLWLSTVPTSFKPWKIFKVPTVARLSPLARSPVMGEWSNRLTFQQWEGRHYLYQPKESTCSALKSMT
jgi:hypothetical protein